MLQILARQHGVASLDQLRALGVSYGQIRHARTSGQVYDLLPGVVQLVGSPDTLRSRSVALVVHAWPDGALADITAGRVWRAPAIPTGPVTLMVPYGTRMCLPDWARLVRSRWMDEGRVLRHDGLVVTSPFRTLFDLGAHFGPKRFEKVAENLWHRRLVTPDDAAAYLRGVRGRGRAGVSRLEAWLDESSARARPSQSGLELELARTLVNVGLPSPERQHALDLGDGRPPIHIDLAYPAVRLGLEPGHSVFHAGADDVRRDLERDRRCAERGWLILRFDEVELRDPSASACEIASVYRSRTRTVPPHPVL